MAALLDRVVFATATAGTGSLTVGAAAAGYRTPASAGAVDGVAYNYVIDDTGNAWERGEGVFSSSGTVMARTVIESTNSNTALSLSGSAVVSIDSFAADINTPNPTEYTTTTPTAPSVGARLFSRKRAGRNMPAALGPVGRAFEAQPHIGLPKIGLATAVGSVTTIQTIGIAAPTASGTATTRSPSSASLLQSTRRIGYVPASAAANQPTGWAVNAVNGAVWRGNAAGLGGFHCLTRFGFNAWTGGAGGNRCFIGMTGANWTTGDPSALLNMIGIGADSGDANFSVMTNDGTGTATKTDTGIAVAADKLYEVRVFGAPNGATLYVSLERLDDATLYEASVTTDMMASASFVLPVIRANTGSSATTGAAIDILHAYIESDI